MSAEAKPARGEGEGAEPRQDSPGAGQIPFVNVVRGHMVCFVEEDVGRVWVNALLVQSVRPGQYPDKGCRIQVLGEELPVVVDDCKPDQAAGRLMQAKLSVSHPVGTMASAFSALGATLLSATLRPKEGDPAKDPSAAAKASSPRGRDRTRRP